MVNLKLLSQPALLATPSITLNHPRAKTIICFKVEHQSRSLLPSFFHVLVPYTLRANSLQLVGAVPAAGVSEFVKTNSAISFKYRQMAICGQHIFAL